MSSCERAVVYHIKSLQPMVPRVPNGWSNYHIGPHWTAMVDIVPHRKTSEWPHQSFIVYSIVLNLTTSNILSTTSGLPNQPNKF